MINYHRVLKTTNLMKTKEDLKAEYNFKADETKLTLQKELNLTDTILKLSIKSFDGCLNSKALREETLNMIEEIAIEKGKILQKLTIIDMLGNNIDKFLNIPKE